MTAQSIITSKKQRKIIRSLLLFDGQTYSQLALMFNEEDKFAYHIKYLLNHEYVYKNDKKYFITEKGKNQITFFNWETLEDIHNYPAVYAVFICEKNNRILLKKKKAIPWTNWYDLPRIKIDEFSNIKSIAKNYLHLGLTTFSLKYVSTHYVTFMTKESHPSWSTVMLFFKVKLNKNHTFLLKKDYNFFLKSDILKIKKLMPDVMHLFTDKDSNYKEYQIFNPY